jgi:hypothetical protein
MPNKLYIYDKSSWQDALQAAGRFDFADKGVVTLPIASRQDVLDGLDKLLSKGATFDRMLIQTHGNTGRIWFGDDKMWDTSWKTYFSNRKYERLFPAESRIYFDGCDVAAGGMGVEFLRAAGRVFLKGMGGEVVGWTSSGLGLPGWWPFIGGHTIHISGQLVRIRFDHQNPDGKLVSDDGLSGPPSSDPLGFGDGNSKVSVGNKI